VALVCSQRRGKRWGRREWLAAARGRKDRVFHGLEGDSKGRKVNTAQCGWRECSVTSDAVPHAKLVGEEDDMRRKSFRRRGMGWEGSGLGPEEERRWDGTGYSEERGRWAREREGSG
jgi:hypothetical protein